MSDDSAYIDAINYITNQAIEEVCKQLEFNLKKIQWDSEIKELLNED